LLSTIVEHDVLDLLAAAASVNVQVVARLATALAREGGGVGRGAAAGSAAGAAATKELARARRRVNAERRAI
jgi:hypothetical protein